MSTVNKAVQCNGEDLVSAAPNRVLVIVELLLKKVEKLEERLNKTCTCQMVCPPPAPRDAPPAALPSKPKSKLVISGNAPIKEASVKQKSTTTTATISNTMTSRITRSQKVLDNINKKSTTEIPKTRESTSNPERDVIDISAVGQSTEDGKWSTVAKKKRPAAVRGILGGGVKGSDVVKNYHFYPFHPETSAADMSNYLKKLANCNAEFTIAKLKSKGDYASFKIGIPVKLSTLILKPDNWPRYSFIKEWVSKIETPRLPTS
jgi:hypothetical protein